MTSIVREIADSLLGKCLRGTCGVCAGNDFFVTRNVSRY